MKRLLWLLLLSVLGMAGLTLLLRSQRVAQPPSPHRREPDTVNEAELPLVEASTDQREEDRLASSPREMAPIAPAPVVTDPMPSLPRRAAVLRGRLLLPDSSPASGVDLRVHGWQANSERVAQHGLPGDWVDPRTVSAHDGFFELSFPPPPAFQFTLDAYLPGYAPNSWRWSGFDEGAIVELGDIALRPGGTIEVHILRPNGSPAGTDWRVHADNDEGAEWDDRDSTRRQGTFDPSRGSWLVSDMPPGLATVSAYSEMASWIKGGAVEVRPGETVSYNLVYEGPENSGRIVVTTFTSPIWENPAPSHVWIESTALAAPLHCTQELGSQSFDFPDLPQGSYKVVIDDPAFERWERAGIHPGQNVRAHLKGSASIRLEVIDRDDGTSVPDWSLSMRKESKTVDGKTVTHWGETPVVLKGQKPPPNGLIDSLVPWNYTLLLEAPSYPMETIAVGDLEAGEERLIRVELSRRGGIDGTVRASSGEPIPQCTVELYPASILGPKPRWWGSSASEELNRKRFGATQSDAEGRFHLPTSAAGPLVVRAIAGSGLHAVLEVPHEAGEATTDVEVRLPPGAFITGRLLVPPGASVAGFMVRAGPQEAVGDMSPADWVEGWDEFEEQPVSENGEFRLGPLVPCSVRFALIRVSLPEGGTPNPPTLVERRLVIVAGENAADIDLRGSWPGTIQVALKAGEDALDGVQTILWRHESDKKTWAASATTNSDGLVTFQPLAGLYSVEVFGAGLLWEFEFPQQFLVDPGQRFEVTLNAPAIRAELLILAQETGEPAVLAPVVLARNCGGGCSLRLTTDAEGRISATLSVGPVWIARSIDPSFGPVPPLDEMTRVEWTAAGPALREVLIPQASSKD